MRWSGRHRLERLAFKPVLIQVFSASADRNPEAGRILDRPTPAQIAREPDVGSVPGVLTDFLRRSAKFVGDALWFLFLSVIFSSISIGVAARLFF